MRSIPDINHIYGTINVFMFKACESGSMFAGLLPPNINIFATTAANSIESSYACYYDEERETYLGDVYSVNWLEDSDQRHSLTTETLQQQFRRVLKETNTSHVQEFGNRSIGRIVLSQFQGIKRYNKTYSEKVAISDAVVSHDVPIAIAFKRLGKEQSPAKRNSSRVKYEQMLKGRAFLVQSVKRLIKELSTKTVSSEAIWSDRKELTNHDCYVNLIEHFDRHCFDLSAHPFALRLLYVFVNMCETLEKQSQANTQIIENWISSIVRHCATNTSAHPFRQIL